MAHEPPTSRPPIGTRVLVHVAVYEPQPATVVPTGRGVPDDQINVMWHEGGPFRAGGVSGVRLDQLEVPRG